MSEYEQIKNNQKLLREATRRLDNVLPSFKRFWLWCWLGFHKSTFSGKQINEYFDNYFEYKCDCGKTELLPEHQHLARQNTKKSNPETSIQGGTRFKYPEFYKDK